MSSLDTSTTLFLALNYTPSPWLHHPNAQNSGSPLGVTPVVQRIDFCSKPAWQAQNFLTLGTLGRNNCVKNSRRRDFFVSFSTLEVTK